MEREKRRWYLMVGLLFFTMMLMGVIESVRSVTMPLIKEEFGASYADQGLFQFFTTASAMVASFLASNIIGKKGSKFITSAGLLIIGVCLGSLYFSFSFIYVTISFIIFRLGYSFYNVGTNGISEVVFVTKVAMMMNVFHGFYGVGSIIGPAMTSGLMNGLGFDWRSMYIVALGLILVAFAASVAFRMPKRQMPKEEGETEAVKEEPDLTVKGAFKQKFVWLFGICMSLVGIMEMAPPTWGIFYLQDVFGFDPTTTGALFLSVYFAIFTLSRVFIGPLLEHFGYMRSLKLGMLFSVAVHYISFALGASGVWVLVLSALSLSFLWPTMVAVLIRVFGKNAGVASGVMFTISPLFSSPAQLVIGQLNNALGIAWGYRILVSLGLVGFVLLSFLSRAVEKRIGYKV